MSWVQTLAATARVVVPVREVVGKQRPRTDYRNHRTYTPTKTLKAEKEVRDAWRAEYGETFAGHDGMSRTDSIETLIDLTSCIAVNALMVAGGEAEANEKDAGAWWAMIALAEAALESYPEDVRAKGYQVVNENTNRELVEQARRKEAEQAAKHVMSIIFGVKKED